MQFYQCPALYTGLLFGVSFQHFVTQSHQHIQVVTCGSTSHPKWQCVQLRAAPGPLPYLAWPTIFQTISCPLHGGQATKSGSAPAGRAVLGVPTLRPGVEGARGR